VHADQVCYKVETFHCCFVFIDCFTTHEGILYFCKYKCECLKLPWIWIVLYFKYFAVSRYNTCYSVWCKWHYIRTLLLLLLLLLLLYFGACKSVSVPALFTHVYNSNNTCIILCLLFDVLSWSVEVLERKPPCGPYLENHCLISCCSFISCLGIRFSYEAANCT
jgi:hypothetical protein